MGKSEIKSVLNRVCAQVWKAKTAEDARQVIITCLKESSIKEDDKKTMIRELQKMTVLAKIQQYFANALLKYEGHGTL